MEEINHYDPSLLLSLVETQMPYGKYKGVLLYKLPVSYLEWMERTGYPKGKLGNQLQLIHLIKINGLTHLLGPLIKK